MYLIKLLESCKDKLEYITMDRLVEILQAQITKKTINMTILELAAYINFNLYVVKLENKPILKKKDLLAALVKFYFYLDDEIFPKGDPIKFCCDRPYRNIHSKNQYDSLKDIILFVISLENSHRYNLSFNSKS